MNFLRLIRYKNLIMVLLIMVLTKYALIDTAIPKPYLSDIDFLIFALSVLFISAGGYIVNDIYDVEIDRINKPQKTYIGNTISKQSAWILYLAFSAVGLALAVYLSITKHLVGHIGYYVFGAACLYFYSRYFQKKPLIGNVIIAFICGALIYLTYSFDCKFSDKTLDATTIEKIASMSLRKFFIDFYMIFSFSGTLIREIIKDIEDVDGDYNAGYNTLPILFGKNRTRNFAIALSIIFAAALTLYSYVFYLIEYYWIFLVVLIITMTFLYFLYQLWSAKSKRQYSKLSQLMKLILFFGILSMILFTFV